MLMQNYADGAVILIDKPKTWTSFDVVNKLRYVLKIKKIGHAGTLDPMATGLLVICTGKWTKRIEEFQSSEKEYVGEMTFGATTPSYDAETEPDAHFEFAHITSQQILEATKPFLGVILQIPPMYSAIKINGKRLYELARKGKTVDVPAREVEIKEFEIVEINLPIVKFRVVCSKGTYIRSLVHDFAKHLQSGAYMSALCRTRNGEFKNEDALSVEDFIAQIKYETNV
ncbi:MAG: tRNA pseudouridine(55) synthase TruB [Bacteroidetes bacterium]|nr:MAG: tRNA pseudouridine(55) synthase TruB [Bacteroidota bacterium]